MSDYRLGAPVELPWWTIPLAAPPLTTLVLGLVLGAPIWAHLVIVVVSLTLLATVIGVSTRVASRNMQSVWISAAYAPWFFVVVLWAVAVATNTSCNCA